MKRKEVFRWWLGKLSRNQNNLGGLGVGDIVIKNAALIFKWWWRYLDGSESYWKRIISSTHHGQGNTRRLLIEEGDTRGLWGRL